jgi:hypothetical protein
MAEFEPLEITVPNDAINPPPKVEAEDSLGAKRAETPPAEPAKKSGEEDGIEVLRRQLAQKQREAEEAKRQREEAEMLARSRAEQIESIKSEAQGTQHTALVNAIASYERDAEMLETRYASLLESGEFREAAKIQRQMAQVEARLTTLNQGKEELEVRLSAPKPAPQPEIRQVQRDPVEERIASLPPASQAWVRAHPEVLSDSRLNSLMTAGHFEAIANNIQADTPEYFSFIENKLGMGAPAPAMQSTAQRNPIASAPVSRSATTSISPERGGTSVVLTPEMRQYAQDLGMDEAEYAANYLYYQQRGEIR